MFERMPETEQEKQKRPLEPRAQKARADRRQHHQCLDVEEALPQRDQSASHGKEAARNQRQNEQSRWDYFRRAEKTAAQQARCKQPAPSDYQRHFQLRRVPAFARVMRTDVAVFRLFEFKAGFFDPGLDIAQGCDLTVVFDNESFGGVSDIRRQHARHFPDGFFNRVTVLRRFQPKHVPFLLAIALRDFRANRFHERRHLRQRHLIMVVMYADFSAAAVAPQVDVGDACASFQEQFEFLEPAKFISFVGDNDSKLKLASLPTCLRLSRPDQTFAMFMMMMMAVIAMVVVVVMVIMMAPMAVVVIAMAMIVAMIAIFAVRVSFVVMSFAVAMFVAAFGAMLMLRFVIVIAFRPVNVLLLVRRSGRNH